MLKWSSAQGSVISGGTLTHPYAAVPWFRTTFLPILIPDFKNVFIHTLSFSREGDPEGGMTRKCTLEHKQRHKTSRPIEAEKMTPNKGPSFSCFLLCYPLETRFDFVLRGLDRKKSVSFYQMTVKGFNLSPSVFRFTFDLFQFVHCLENHIIPCI